MIRALLTRARIMRMAANPDRRIPYLLTDKAKALR